MTEIEFLKGLVIRASKLITNEVVVKAKDDKVVFKWEAYKPVFDKLDEIII